MDGRVGVIRDVLESCGFTYVAILYCMAKYARTLYGTFCGTVDSQQSSGEDKMMCLMDTALKEQIF